MKKVKVGLLALVLLATPFVVGADHHQSSSQSRWAQSAIGWKPTLLVQLAVEDLDRAVAFYHDVLEFDLERRDDDLQWARMKCGVKGVTIGLGVQPRVKGSGSVSLNFGVDDITQARRVLEARGVTFLGPTIDIPGVVQLADFKDPDGNLIRLADDY